MTYLRSWLQLPKRYANGCRPIPGPGSQNISTYQAGFLTYGGGGGTVIVEGPVERMTPEDVRADLIAEGRECRASGDYARALELLHQVGDIEGIDGTEYDP